MTQCSLVTLTDVSERRTAFTVKMGPSSTEVLGATFYNKRQGHANIQGVRIQNVREFPRSPNLVILYGHVHMTKPRRANTQDRVVCVLCVVFNDICIRELEL